jgi:predicted HAD superfamily phosphohydrolase
MVTFGRVLLWTVVLVAPGGFLLVPVLAAHSLSSRTDRSLSLRERLTQLVDQARQALSGLQRHWTKS